MVAPNPQIRISPSGPLAGETDDGGLAPPLDSIVGNLYAPVPTGATDQLLAASIGPVGGPADKEDYCYLYSGANPDVAKVNSEINLFGLSAGVVYGAGVWLVEAELEVGFTTSLPLDAASPAKLIINGQLANADGSFVKGDVDTGTVYGSLVAIGAVDGAASSFATMKSVLYRSLIEITEANVLSAGGALTDFNLRLERASGAPAGAYDADSGYLQIGINSSIRVTRFR